MFKKGHSLNKRYPFSQSKEFFIQLLENHTRDQIAEMYGCDPALISYYTKKFGLVNPRRRYNRPNLDPNPELSYIVGVLCGDGSVTKSKNYDYAIKLSATDKDFVEEFARCLTKLMGRSKPYSVYIVKSTTAPDYKGSVQWIVTARSKELYNYYVSKQYMQCIEQYPAEFLRGFWDSEGSIHSYQQNKNWCRNWCIDCTNTDIGLLQIVQQLMRSVGIESNIILSNKKGSKETLRGREFVKKKDVYKLTVPRKHHHRFAGEIGFTTKRKQERLLELINSTTEPPETKVCPVCGTVFAPDPLSQRFCCYKHKKSFGHVKEHNSLTDEQTTKLYEATRKLYPQMINKRGYITNLDVSKIKKKKRC